MHQPPSDMHHQQQSMHHQPSDMQLPPSDAVKQEYNIDNHRNIVSLNGPYQAFSTKFTVLGAGKYSGVVVDQNQLDTADTLPYRESSTTTDGEWFSGELEYTDAIPLQFYLVLIADEPTTVTVQLLREPREAKPQLPPGIPETPAPIPVASTATSSNTWLIVGIAVIVAVVVAMLLLTMKRGGGVPSVDDILAGF